MVAAFAFMCFTVLAPWQLGKNTSTEHRNQLIADSVTSDPVPVETLLAAAGPSPDDEWRQVTASGTYLPDRDVLVRLRSIGDAPAYEVLTPFRLADGRIVLVNRGYVRPAEGTRVPPYEPAPAGPITLEARIRMSEGTVPGKEPLTEGGVRQVYFIDAAQVGGFAGIDLVGGYLQLSDGQPGGLGTIPLPQLDAGPYLSYGLQWLAFGIMAPLGLAYFIRAELRERRKEKSGAQPASTPKPAAAAESAQSAADTAAPDAEFTLPPRRRMLARSRPGAASAPMTPTEAKLADRYGKRR